MTFVKEADRASTALERQMPRQILAFTETPIIRRSLLIITHSVSVADQSWSSISHPSSSQSLHSPSFLYLFVMMIVMVIITIMFLPFLMTPSTKYMLGG